MVNRESASVMMNDDEENKGEEYEEPSPPGTRPSSEESVVKQKLEKIPEEEVADDDCIGKLKKKKKRRIATGEDLKEGEEQELKEGSEKSAVDGAVQRRKKKKRKSERGDDLKKGDEEMEVNEEESEEAALPVAVPVGKPVRISGKGKTRRTHYAAFEYRGNSYDLRDPVLVVPEELDQKPYVAIIKDIFQSKEGLMITGHWFYRPEDAERRGGGLWQPCDKRELFFSFHFDEVPAECVMHRCVVHFVPVLKQLPNCKQYPGFIVRRVYDDVGQKLHKLNSRHFEDSKLQEIDSLVQKTLSNLEDLPDIRTGDTERA